MGAEKVRCGSHNVSANTANSFFLPICYCVYATCRVDKKAPGRSGAVPSDNHDQQHTLEEDPTYSTIDDKEREVVVLSGNPAYSKHDHTHPSIELSQEQESGLGAGRGGNVLETATAK